MKKNKYDILSELIKKINYESKDNLYAVITYVFPTSAYSSYFIFCEVIQKKLAGKVTTFNLGDDKLEDVLQKYIVPTSEKFFYYVDDLVTYLVNFCYDNNIILDFYLTTLLKNEYETHEIHTKCTYFENMNIIDDL